MSEFWDEYKKRMIYGDALGPPTSATQSAAKGLADVGKQPPRPAPSGGGGGGSYEAGFDIDFRYSLRSILLMFGLAALFAGLTVLCGYYIVELKPFTWFLFLITKVFAAIGAWLVLANLFRIVLLLIIKLMCMRPVFFAVLFGGLGFVVGGVLDWKVLHNFELDFTVQEVAIFDYVYPGVTLGPLLGIGLGALWGLFLDYRIRRRRRKLAQAN